MKKIYSLDLFEMEKKEKKNEWFSRNTECFI